MKLLYVTYNLFSFFFLTKLIEIIMACDLTSVLADYLKKVKRELIFLNRRFHNIVLLYNRELGKNAYLASEVCLQRKVEGTLS